MRADLAERVAAACKHVKSEEEFYRRTSTVNYRRWRCLQLTAIIASGVGMIVGPLEMPAGYGDYAWIRSLPAAFAALASAILAGFNFQKDAIAQIVTADSLCGEQLKFITNAPPYEADADEKNLGLFVVRTTQMISNEIAGWAEGTAKAPQAD